MNIINLTPHNITLCGRTLEPSGDVARVSTIWLRKDTVDHIPIYKPRAVGVGGLPDCKPGVIYVASAFVAQAAAKRGRTDVFSPATGHPACERDEDGRIMNAPGLAIWR